MIFSFFAVTILVGLAGALGACTRYLLGRFVAERIGSRFPYGTLFINVSGAFLIGLLFALAARRLISPTAQATLATGFLGGYTTFSTMSWEGVQLARGGSARAFMSYLGGSIISGLLAATSGLLLGWWL
ncbi:MAG TPA: fluoride efflux transporter CrcB [Ktedonobacteraceae bacterium]|nr:fluoride efflux transporter CrcB [Ktedonobacteraceae bacterium]